jgi:hypothetical protein
LLNVDGTVVEGEEVAFQLATGGFWVAHHPPGTALHSGAQPSDPPTLPDQSDSEASSTTPSSADTNGSES